MIKGQEQIPYQTLLLEIVVVGLFVCLFLNLEREKNKNGKRKRREICKIVSNMEKTIKKYVLVFSSIGNDNTN